MTAQAVQIQTTAVRPIAVIVQQGKILDYIDGITQRNETPEEYVRQEIAKSLVREYGYEKGEVSVEFLLRLGSRKPRADLVIFDEGEKHNQDRARVIIEIEFGVVTFGILIPAVAAVGTLDVAPAPGNGAGLDFVLRIAVRADQPHRSPRPSQTHRRGPCSLLR